MEKSGENMLLYNSFFIILISWTTATREKRYIAGKGCGTQIPFKYSWRVPENEEERSCTFVTDPEEYAKYEKLYAKAQWKVSPYGECSKTCGGGIKEALRECWKGDEKVDSEQCHGPDIQGNSLSLSYSD